MGAVAVVPAAAAVVVQAALLQAMDRAAAVDLGLEVATDQELVMGQAQTAHLAQLRRPIQIIHSVGMVALAEQVDKLAEAESVIHIWIKVHVTALLVVSGWVDVA